MTPEDLAALHARCLATPRPYTAAEFAALLASPDCFLLAEPAGFALGRAVADEAELLTLAVDPSHRRRGTGNRLVARFEDEARRRGAGRALLEVAADNTAAIGLYRRAGYAKSGRRKGYYCCPDGLTIDALLLSKRLLSD